MDKNEEKKKRKEETILKELQLLGKMVKEHEWTVFGQKEAEEEARIETELNLEASDSTPSKHEDG